MVRQLDSGLDDVAWVRVLAIALCCVLGRTLFSHSASLHTGV